MKEKSKEENMKALSIEEKAKRFDEALAKAKAFAIDLPNGRNDRLYHIWDLETIFPELKESEDEKMRKSIIYALRNGGFYDNDKTDEAIAWLEKQGKKESDPLFSKMKEAGYEWDAEKKELKKLRDE